MLYAKFGEHIQNHTNITQESGALGMEKERLSIINLQGYLQKFCHSHIAGR